MTVLYLFMKGADDFSTLTFMHDKRVNYATVLTAKICTHEAQSPSRVLRLPVGIVPFSCLKRPCKRIKISPKKFNYELNEEFFILMLHKTTNKLKFKF